MQDAHITEEMNRQQTIVAVATAATAVCALTTVYVLYTNAQKKDEAKTRKEEDDIETKDEQNSDVKEEEEFVKPTPSVSNTPSDSLNCQTIVCKNNKSEPPPNFAWTVLWDMENIPVPRTVSGTHFVQSLRHRLSHYHPGTTSPILRINAITNIHKTPVPLRYELQANGVVISHVETKGRKEAADKALITELCLVTREHQPPFGIALISGDGDFSHAVSRISGLGYFIVIIAPTNRRCFSGVLSRVPDDVIPLHVVLNDYTQSHSYADMVSRDLAAVNAIHRLPNARVSGVKDVPQYPKRRKGQVQGGKSNDRRNHGGTKKRDGTKDKVEAKVERIARLPLLPAKADTFANGKSKPLSPLAPIDTPGAEGQAYGKPVATMPPVVPSPPPSLLSRPAAVHEDGEPVAIHNISNMTARARRTVRFEDELGLTRRRRTNRDHHQTPHYIKGAKPAPRRQTTRGTGHATSKAGLVNTVDKNDQATPAKLERRENARNAERILATGIHNGLGWEGIAKPGLYIEWFRFPSLLAVVILVLTTLKLLRSLWSF